MKNMLIIGGGSIGKRHLRNLMSLGEKNITVAEVNDARRAEIQKEFGVETDKSVDSAFKKKDFSIAFVCSPSIFHLENALYCAERGCDIFVEKPLSHTIDGIQKLEKIAERKKLITMVGSNWKFYPLFLKMKELLDAGAIGKLLGARCQFGFYLPDWHPWEDYTKGYSANKKLGGGILLDSHEFDYLPWFVGSKVKKLACIAAKTSELSIDVEDVAETILYFENGVIGEIHLDYIQRFYQRNFEFFGESGTIIWDTNLKKVTIKSKADGDKEFPLAENYDLNAMYMEEIKHFLDCVESRKETITPFLYGVKVVELIDAAKKSSENNRFVEI